jgi:Protein of unknown function (DUF1822)
MSSIDTSFSIPIKLKNEAYSYAKKFAGEQATVEKGKQVYLNTLAVYAVHSYLEWMDFKTDITQGDCWNPSIRAIFDVADLVLPGIGKLECRPVLPGETTINLPPEVMSDRIGYIVVQFEEKLDKVNLLGFCPLDNPENTPEEIQISELKSLEEMTEYLGDLEEISFSSDTFPPILVNLSQWLEGIINDTDKAWKTVEEILGTHKTQLMLAARRGDNSSAVIRATEISLQREDIVYSFALVVAVMSRYNDKRDIGLQIHPLNQTYLPLNLKFVAFDESGILAQEEAKNRKREWMQLNIKEGKPKEEFSVKIELDGATSIGKFVI